MELSFMGDVAVLLRSATDVVLVAFISLIQSQLNLSPSSTAVDELRGKNLQPFATTLG
jgi:hypothetical protein